jgi:4-amino-4-deoxy-L-arabinose transferase-like glycosyltransferase
VPDLLRRIEPEDLVLVALTLALKAALLGLGIFALLIITGTELTNGLYGAAQLWDRWDGPHYVDLAVLGYRATDPRVQTIEGYTRAFPGDLPLYIVFFPLFPWLASVVNALFHIPLVSVFIVSTIASLFVAPLLVRLVRADFGQDAGLRAAGFLLIFPTAYFLHIGYTESLFLALVLGSFLAVRHDHWWLAGALGGLAALTRINGLVLVPALAAEAWLEWDADAEHRLRAHWLAIGLVVVGFCAYLGLNLAVYGDPLTFLNVQNGHWFKSLAPPWDGIAAVVDRIPHPIGDSAFMYGWMELAFIALGMVGTVIAAFRFRPSWFVWMAVNWLLFTSTAFVLSVPRYSLTLFPLFAWFALDVRRWWLGIPFVLVSIGLLGFFASQFAVGRWAF